MDETPSILQRVLMSLDDTHDTLTAWKGRPGFNRKNTLLSRIRSEIEDLDLANTSRACKDVLMAAKRKIFKL